MRAFFIQKFVQSQTLSREKLLNLLSYKKCAHKMLMKLTPWRHRFHYQSSLRHHCGALRLQSWRELSSQSGFGNRKVTSSVATSFIKGNRDRRKLACSSGFTQMNMKGHSFEFYVLCGNLLRVICHRECCLKNDRRILNPNNALGTPTMVWSGQYQILFEACGNIP